VVKNRVLVKKALGWQKPPLLKSFNRGLRLNTAQAEQVDSASLLEREITMQNFKTIAFAKTAVKTAVLTLAEIKAAVEAFDRGETNVLNALDAIIAAAEAYRAAALPRTKAG
jgi:hypothetical protein